MTENGFTARQRITLAMIVRGHGENLDRCLHSAVPHVDEVVIVDTGSNPETREFVHNRVLGSPLKYIAYTDPKNHPQWISNFSAARDVSFAAATGDLILWLDSDDELIGGHMMRKFVEETCSGPPRDSRIDCVQMRYDYQHNAQGQCSLRQRKFRLVRTGHMKWEDPIHEFLVPCRPGTMHDEPWDLPFWVKHHSQSDEASMVASAERNLWVIETWEADGHDLHGRLHQGKADALRTLGRFQESIDSYSACLTCSSDPEERYQAYLRRGDCYRLLGKLDPAMDDYARAERSHPSYKVAYLAMAEALMDQHRCEQAIIWCDKADKAGDDGKSIMHNPAASSLVGPFVRARAFMELQQYEKGLYWCNRLAQASPDNEAVKTLVKMAATAVHSKRLNDAMGLLMDEVGADDVRRKHLALGAPDVLKALPAISSAFVPELPTDKPSIAIYCHRTINVWGPRGLERGVGGSEEAVIYMSRLLVERGFHVEVYGTPPAQEIGQDEQGVWWLPFHAWQDERAYDVFVGWRDTRYMGLGTSAKLRYLWIQDIPVKEWYTPEFLGTIDGILTISKAQALFLPKAAFQKAIHSGNGIDPQVCVDGVNSNTRFGYFSSPDRGLEQLLEQWPVIKAAIPDARLDVFYGFRDVYMAAAEKNQKWLDLKEKIERLAQQPGVVWRGMVGHGELHAEMAAIGFWLYPTSFEESYCNNAAKAQAMGAIPITSRYGKSSLPEVCGIWDLGPEDQPGKLYKDDPAALSAWTARVIEVANMPADELARHRALMKMWARKELSWASRADQWADLFRVGLFHREVLSSPSSVEPAPVLAS